MSDDDLVTKARNGDEASWDNLLEKFKPILTSKVRKYYLPLCDHNDIFQEAQVGFLQAVRSYKAGSVPFRYYAEICIKNHFRALIISAHAKGRHKLNNALSISTEYFPDGGPCTLEEVIPSKDYNPLEMLLLKEFMAEFSNSLSDREKRVFQHRNCGRSYEEIARLEGTSIRAIGYTVRRIKDKALMQK